MQVQVEAKMLEKALKQMKSTIPTGKRDLEALKFVELRSTVDNRVYLTGSDLDTFIKIAVLGCKSYVNNGGLAYLEYKSLKKAVASMNGVITIDTEDKENFATVTDGTGTRQCSIAIFPPEDYPLLPPEDRYNDLFIVENNFKDAVSRSLKCAGKNGEQINGVILETNDKHISVIATDTYRISFMDVKVLTYRSTFKKQILIPISTAKAIKGLNSTDDIKISIGENFARFRCGEADVVCRIRNNISLPDYHRIITSFTQGNSFTFDVPELKSALKWLGTTAPKVSSPISFFNESGQENPVTLQVTETDNRVEVQPISKDTSSGETSCGVAMALNNLIDAVQACPGNKLSITFSEYDPNSNAVLIKDVYYNNYRQYLMPINIGQRK